MSHDTKDVRRSNRIAGRPPSVTESNQPMPTTTNVPAMAAFPTNPHHPNNQSSDLLSESNNSYDQGQVQPTYTHTNNNNVPLFHPSYVPSNASLSNPSPITQVQGTTRISNAQHPTMQHIPGQNHIPNFMPSYNQLPMLPDMHPSMNQQFQSPPNQPFHPNIQTNQHQLAMQFNTMKQQMQYDHERQMRDLEHRFNQKLQQNNIELSRTLATTFKNMKTLMYYLRS
jgi:hypothetical protein